MPESDLIARKAALRKALEAKLGALHLYAGHEPSDYQEEALLQFALAKLDQCNKCGGKGHTWQRHELLPCPTCTPELERLEAAIGLKA